MIVHLKIKKASSFNPVTRMICKKSHGTYIYWFELEPETAEQVRKRLKEIEPDGRLCANCAKGIPSK